MGPEPDPPHTPQPEMALQYHTVISRARHLSWVPEARGPAKRASRRTREGSPHQTSRHGRARAEHGAGATLEVARLGTGVGRVYNHNHNHNHGVAMGEVRDRQFQLAANGRGRDDLLGSSSGSAGTGQHERLARLPSALAIALRELAAAQAIAIAEEQRRPVTAVALAEQLSSAAPARV